MSQIVYLAVDIKNHNDSTLNFTGYVIDTVDEKTLEIIQNFRESNTKNMLYDVHRITIQMFEYKILNPEKFKMYQEVFNFVGSYYTNMSYLNIIPSILRVHLENKIYDLVTKIFEYYEITNPQFTEDFKTNYLETDCVLSGNHEELSVYKLFLESWLDYVNYLKSQKIPGNSWDKNLNDIIGSYLNVNSWYCLETDRHRIYGFFNNQIGCGYDIEDIISNKTWLLDEEADNVIKYMNKFNYQTIYLYKSWKN